MARAGAEAAVPVWARVGSRYNEVQTEQVWWGVISLEHIQKCTVQKC